MEERVSVANMMISACDTVENIVGKQEVACNRHFLPFHLCFQKPSFIHRINRVPQFACCCGRLLKVLFMNRVLLGSVVKDETCDLYVLGWSLTRTIGFLNPFLTTNFRVFKIQSICR